MPTVVVELTRPLGVGRTLRGATRDAVWLTSAGLVLACAHSPDAVRSALDKGCPPDAPALGVPPVLRDSLPPRVDFGYLKQGWIDVARQVPGGFGGLASEGGVPVVFLVDTTKRAEAMAALIARGSLPAGGEKRVRKVRWDAAQLYDWYRYLTLHFQFPAGDAEGIVAWGSDEVESRLWFGMRDEAARQRFERALARLPLPCFLVTLEVTGPYVPE